jgi:hypothetical protein
MPEPEPYDPWRSTVRRFAQSVAASMNRLEATLRPVRGEEFAA